MLIVLQIIFWIGVLLMFHSYVLYPVILSLIAGQKKFSYLQYSFERENELPDVYILFSVYNGGRVLEKKLESMLNSSYPPDKIKILVGSDESDDDTNTITETFSSKDLRVQLYIYSRRGKANVLNELVKEVPKSASVLVIFSDVHAIFDRETIPELVRYFKDPQVGIVAASYINNNENSSGISQQEKAYIARENKIKLEESLSFGAMMGVYGACYAIPVTDIPVFPSNILMEDFYITMWQLQRGKHSILNPAARFYLNNPNSIEIEYRRKKRISAGNFQNLSHFIHLTLPSRKGVAFCFWSHKLIRWLGPFIIILELLVLISFQILSVGFYDWIALGAEGLLFLALLDIPFQKIGINIGLLRFVNYFLQMNVALLDGFIWFCRGIKSNVWSPTKRNI